MQEDTDILLFYPQGMDEDDLDGLLDQIGEMPDLEFKDDGYIELVLRILGLMCDNQHFGLQVRTVYVPICTSY